MPVALITPKTVINRFPGYILYVGEKVYLGEKEGTALRDFWFWKLDKANQVQQFARADSGRITFDEATNDLVLNLDHAAVESRDEKAPESFSEDTAIMVSERRSRTG